MKTYALILVSFCLLITSCGQPIAYVGDTFKATPSVAVFYSLHDVKRDYKIMGHIRSQYYAQNSAKRKLIKFAQKAGADAIVFAPMDSTKTNPTNRITADLLKYN